MSRLKDKELIELMREENKQDKTKADEISAEIDKEIRKAKPDYDRIAELSELYAELTREHDKVQDSRSEHIQSINTVMKKTRSKPIYLRFLTIAARLAMILFSANCVTVYAFDMNIFKAIVHYASNGFSVDFVSKTVVNDDPYGIRSECEKYGFSPEVPTYLPQGFELTNIVYNNYGICNDVRFNYDSKDMEITIDYQLYTNPEDISNTGFPSDDFNIKEIEINGRPAVISEEDDQFTLVYAKDNILLTIFTQNVPYEECYKMTDSIK